MKVIYKLLLLVAGGLLIFGLFSALKDKVPGKQSLPFETKVKVAVKTSADRSEDPVIKIETRVRQMRNNNPPLNTDSVRQQRNLARAANMEWIKESTSKYSPDSWQLLMQYDQLPENAEARSENNQIITTRKNLETFYYLRGRTRLDLLASMETNVHEIAHAYFDQNAFRYTSDNNLTMSWNNANGFIYISPSEGFFVAFPLKLMFPSRELLKVIPADLQTFRFDTYIDGSTSTQSEGIIGLLNELYAYYTGSKYCFDMLEPYKTAAGSDGSGLFEWASRTQSTMSAFYEFEFFISEYLLYMKEHYPGNYERLRNNRSFTEACATVHILYKQLIDKYQQRIRDEIKLVNSSGVAEAKTEKGWLWVKPGDSNVASGTPVFSEEREKLLTILGSRRYREIDADFNLKLP